MSLRPEAPAPLSRRGPRPLGLHLALAWLKSNGCTAESMSWSAAWQRMLTTGTLPPAEFPFASQDQALIAGIAAYRRSPYTRQMPDPPSLWSEGETRLLDYRQPGGHGPALVFIPSLINRAYILDLMPEASMLRWLAAQGAQPLLLDWGWPGAVERQFTLTDTIAGRLERALASIEGPLILAGYCMGGLLALAAALRQPGRIAGLALLATPWDFQAADPAAARRLGDSLPWLEPAMRLGGALPIDTLQTLFTALDPFGVGDKFRSFAELDKTSPRAKRFVAMEDWLADGVPLGAVAAREMISQWYGQNLPARGQWRVAGLPVDPARLEVPAFCAIPLRDKLVPPASARPLAAALRHATIIEPAAGHVGMVAGANAQAALWQPFVDWLQGLC
jgi:polyhydroxyalkanoate synthase